MNIKRIQILYLVIAILAIGCITLWVLLAQRWYCNRQELIEVLEDEHYTIQQYIDWITPHWGL